MRIAVPVESDKSTIARKTGQSAFFAIYENEKVVDYIQNRQGHADKGEGRGEGGEHHKHERMQNAESANVHRKDISKLSDCDLILLQVVGEHMKETLISMGVEVKKVRQKDGSTADEVVQKFLAKTL